MNQILNIIHNLCSKKKIKYLCLFNDLFDKNELFLFNNFPKETTQILTISSKNTA